MQNRWRPKVDALIRLAKDQAGKPEGELAREKLQQILDKYPWTAQEHKPLGDFAVSDFLRMKRVGVSHEGSWTGRNLQEVLTTMVMDYQRRIEEHKRLQMLLAA